MWAGESRILLGAYEDGEGHRIFGGVAHLVEHLPCTEKVASSILVASTNLKKNTL